MSKIKKLISVLLACTLLVSLSTSVLASEDPLIQDNPTGTIYENSDARSLPHAVQLTATRASSTRVNANLLLIPSFGFPIIDNAGVFLVYRDGPGAPITTKVRNTGMFGAYISVTESFAVPSTATSGYAQATFYMGASSTTLTNSF